MVRRMPILGNLSEFPLPEVLLLIGTRTGRLRLLDVPEFGIMNIDFSNGQVHALQIGNKILTESRDMIAKLSAVVQSQGGMFEFRIHPVESVLRQQPLLVNELVMSLVCYVDEQIAAQSTAAAMHHWYILEAYQPDIWIEPELHGFYILAMPHLAVGVHLDELAQKMDLPLSDVHRNLTNLRLLGLIKMIDGAKTPAGGEVDMEEKIARKSNEFLRASRAATEIKKISARLQGNR